MHTAHDGRQPDALNASGGETPDLHAEALTLHPQTQCMTYGDLRPMLSGSPSQQEMAFLRISQLARGDGPLAAPHLLEAVMIAVTVINPQSSERSPSAGVRKQAVLALEAIGAAAALQAQLPADLRDEAFSVLALIPIQRGRINQVNGSLHDVFDGPLKEQDVDVRSLAERAAAFFAPPHPAAAAPAKAA